MSQVIQEPKCDANQVDTGPIALPSNRINRPMEVDGTCTKYPMTRQKRQAIIFNHYKFNSQLKLHEREGTHYDVERLEGTVLPKFNFAVTVYHDLTKLEILNKMIEIKKTNFEEYDCLAIFVLSHGRENGIYAKDDYYTPDELWKPLSTTECVSLAGKPKLIFINACRGLGRDYGDVQFVAKSIDGHLFRPPTTEDYSLMYNIPKNVDIFVAYSTYEGYVSHRPPEGAWFIQALCDVLQDEELNKKDIKTIMTRVTNIVSLREARFDSKQVPVTVSTLMRDLYLY